MTPSHRHGITMPRRAVWLSDLSSDQEHQHDELQGHQQCSNPVVLQPCARI